MHLARTVCEENGEKHKLQSCIHRTDNHHSLGLCQIVTLCVGLRQIVTPSLLPDISDSDSAAMRWG